MTSEEKQASPRRRISVDEELLYQLLNATDDHVGTQVRQIAGLVLRDIHGGPARLPQYVEAAIVEAERICAREEATGDKRRYPPLSYDRIRVLAMPQADGKDWGAPALRVEERAMAQEILTLRGLVRYDVDVLDDEEAWFLTLEGRRYVYADPDSYPFSIREIAHVLGMLSRFAGHLSRHYSIAQHSVVVADLVRREVRRAAGCGEPVVDEAAILRAALLHDASEHMLLDVPRPLKQMPLMRGYRDLEDRTQRAILRRFGLERFHDLPAIKRADMLALASEKRSLRPPSQHKQEWDPSDPEIASELVEVRSLSARDAAALFVERWRSFGGEWVEDPNASSGLP